MIATPTALADRTFDRDECGRAALCSGVHGTPTLISFRVGAEGDQVGDAQPRAALETRLEPRLAVA